MSKRTRKVINYYESVDSDVSNTDTVKNKKDKQKSKSSETEKENTKDSKSKKQKDLKENNVEVNDKSKATSVKKSKNVSKKTSDETKSTKSKSRSKRTKAEDVNNDSDNKTKSIKSTSKNKRTRKNQEDESTSTTTSTSKGKKSKESKKAEEIIEEEISNNKTTSRKRKVSEEKLITTEKENKSSKAKKNKTETDYESINFYYDQANWNLKISSWNVDGIRAWLNKGGLEYIFREKPDIMCLQETKCSFDKLPKEIKSLNGYHCYWNSADKDGYSGVGLLSKQLALNVINGIDDQEHDAEGRIITAEFEKFYVVSVYVPNSGRGLVTLPKRLDWNEKFKKFINGLNKKKPVIVCGDMNVSHKEIDLKNPKTNKKNAGFTQEERDGMTDFLQNGYVDTYRELYPDKEEVYTFWTYMMNSRAKNVGWRLDYFLVSERFQSKVIDHIVRSEVYGSDHCPIVLILKI